MSRIQNEPFLKNSNDEKRYHFRQMSFNRRTPAKTLLLILLIPIASSCEKEGGSQPDPPGTITQNMAEDYEYPVGISLAGVYSWHACTLSWTTPSTIWVDGYRNMYTDDVSINPSSVAICSLGKVNGLGAITSIPESGFSPESFTAPSTSRWSTTGRRASNISTNWSLSTSRPSGALRGRIPRPIRTSFPTSASCSR